MVAKLTKEEKKLLKEAKKLAKFEAEQEAKRQEKRVELKREISSQAQRKGELDRSWRELMIRIKEPIFRQDVEVMYHVFERTYDKKDHLINYTLHLCNVADEQFQRTLSSFCDTIDSTINKFLSDLEEMSANNKKRTDALLKYGEDTANQIMTEHDIAETHLQLILFHAHTLSDNYAWTKRGENLVKEDEEQNKYANERDNLRSFLDNNYNNVWENYKAVLKAYVLNTADNQKQVRKLRTKETQMADIIASQAKKIGNNGGLLKRLRTELAAYETGTKQAAFRDRRDRHREACMSLKNKLNSSMALDRHQLETLVDCSDEAVSWLDGAYKKCENIMRLAALCRKLETQREKIMPYGFFEPQSAVKLKPSRRLQSDADDLLINNVTSSCGLTRLWQRVAKAELSKKALLQEKRLLLEENAAIERKLLEYRGQRITPHTFSCICGPTEAKKKSISRPVAIDGNMEISKFVSKNAK